MAQQLRIQIPEEHRFVSSALGSTIELDSGVEDEPSDFSLPEAPAVYCSRKDIGGLR